MLLQHQYLSLTCEVWSDFATTSVTHVLRTVIKFSGYSDHYGCRCHSQYQLVAKCRFYINRHFDCWGRRSCFFFMSNICFVYEESVWPEQCYILQTWGYILQTWGRWLREENLPKATLIAEREEVEKGNKQAMNHSAHWFGLAACPSQI